MMPRIIVISLAALFMLGGTAQAAQLPDQTLKSADQRITFHGKAADPTGQGYWFPAAQTCTGDTCDSFLLKVDLPAGTFDKYPKSPAPGGTTRVQAEGPTDMPGDGVLISIKWPTDFDQYNLYVEDESTGQTVAQGLDLDSNAQSVLLSHPHNGTYKVTVVPFYTSFEKADGQYKGEAEVFLDPTQRHKRTERLLPEIETIAPSNFHIGDVPPLPSNPMGWRYTSNGTFANSCYTDETEQYGSTRCLRFDNTIRNVGEGPFVLRFAWSPDAVTNHCKMDQQILSSDGTVSDRDAGPCNFHPQHAHFHYQHMAIYQLYSVDGAGWPAAKPAVGGTKIGFCTIDVDDYSFGRPAAEQRPRTYSFPTCNVPNAYTTRTDGPYGPASPPEYMGISPGWGDIYTWDLPVQYLDISHVPDGTYEVVSRANPDGMLTTAAHGRETGVTCIAIKGTSVKVLHELASQANSTPLPNCNGRSAVLGVKKAKKKHHARHKHHHRKHHRHHKTRHHRRGH